MHFTFFLKDPIRDTKGFILTLVQSEQVLLEKWLKRHILKDKQGIMKFTNNIDNFFDLYLHINSNEEKILKIIEENPERVDNLKENNKIHLKVIKELKKNNSNALYASYLTENQRKTFDFYPRKIINGIKKHIEWTDEIIEDLKKRRNIKKQSLKEIANAYNVTNITILNKLGKTHTKYKQNMKREMKEKMCKTLTKRQKMLDFTKEDIEEMKRMYWDKISMTEIGKRFNCSREMIRLKLKENGIDGKLRQKIDVNNLKYYLSQNMSFKEIAEKLNIKNPQYIYKVLKKHNLKPKELKSTNR